MRFPCSVTTHFMEIYSIHTNRYDWMFLCTHYAVFLYVNEPVALHRGSGLHKHPLFFLIYIKGPILCKIHCTSVFYQQCVVC